MVDHGLGLYTLYGHCSTILVQQDEIIGAGTPIAKTGIDRIGSRRSSTLWSFSSRDRGQTGRVDG